MLRRISRVHVDLRVQYNAPYHLGFRDKFEYPFFSLILFILFSLFVRQFTSSETQT